METDQRVYTWCMPRLKNLFGSNYYIYMIMNTLLTRSLHWFWKCHAWTHTDDRRGKNNVCTASNQFHLVRCVEHNILLFSDVYIPIFQLWARLTTAPGCRNTIISCRNTFVSCRNTVVSCRTRKSQNLMPVRKSSSQQFTTSKTANWTSASPDGDNRMAKLPSSYVM